MLRIGDEVLQKELSKKINKILSNITKHDDWESRYFRYKRFESMLDSYIDTTPDISNEDNINKGGM